jgi:hypothetical protein
MATNSGTLTLAGTRGHDKKCSHDQKWAPHIGQHEPRPARSKNRQRKPDERNKTKKFCSATERVDKKARKDEATVTDGMDWKKESVLSSDSRTQLKQTSSLSAMTSSNSAR